MLLSSFIRTFFLGLLVLVIMPIFAEGENQLTQFPLDFTPNSSALYGNYIYINNTHDASVSVLDVVSNQIKKIIPVEPGPIFSI
jgi:YVTN family beta-propeller protein